MHHIRRLFKSQQLYEPINRYRDEAAIAEDEAEAEAEAEAEDAFESREKPFSQLEYWIFLLMGIAMLWAWNMFLAAAPYFQHRFSSDKWILAHFQSAEISVSTITNLGSMLALTKLQKNASYPYRIASSLCINIICFTLLALSTLLTTSARLYFGFLMFIVFVASLATGLIQNGIFAYVSGFGRSEYVQAIMTGQAVAGVLPCLAQIASVLAVPKRDEQSPEQIPSESPKSAFAYFLTATAVSMISLIAFLHLLRRRSTSTLQISRPLPKATTNSTSSSSAAANSPPTSPTTPRKPIPLTRLFLLLPSRSSALFLCFAITMTFPVFTSSIPSVRAPHPIPPTLFIPLAFLVWNVGDLLGRLLTLLPPQLRLISSSHAHALLVLSVARLLFIPLYLLCNFRGRGARVPSDLFYLAVVQLWFGISNGFLGSSCMMGAGEAAGVGEAEREAVGGFMGLCLVAGLTVGSLASFLVGGGLS